MRKSLLSSIALCALLVGCSPETPEDAKPVIRPVLYVVAQQHAQVAPQFAGIIEPQDEVNLGFQLLGRIVSRNVDIGDTITAGQILASLDSTTQSLDLLAAESNLLVAKAALENANNTLKRTTSLHDSGNTSDANLEIAQQNQETAQSNAIGREADLSKAQDQMSYTEIKAPYDGIVTAVAAESGQVISQGQTVLTVAKPDLRDALIDIHDEIARTMKLDTSFKIALQLDPTRVVDGKIREISPTIDQVTRTRRIKIALSNPTDAFRIGSTIIATIDEKSDNILTIPATSILEKDEKHYVWIIDDASKTVKQRPVTTQNFTNGSVIVTDGIEPGEKIVTAGVHQLEDGQEVKLGEAQL